MARRNGTKKAGALDIRSITGLLLGAYGVVLLVLGLFFTTERDLERAQGQNLNLWAGAGLVVFALLMLLWARLRPIEVPAEQPADAPAP